MRNIIFDFDSTVITGESLEILLAPILVKEPCKLKAIEIITNKGMAGELDFKTSLEQRLAIAQPTKQAINDFVVDNCPLAFSSGIEELVKKLHTNGDNVWIFSGGLADSIRPFAKYLNIPEQNVYAVEVNWDSRGNFLSLNPDNGASISKLEAMKKVKDNFTRETIIIGDGFTDFQLYQQGYATKFIAYTEHQARDNVIANAEYMASNIQELAEELKITL